MSRTMRLRKGYTLIELLVVLGVLAVLASMAMPLADMTVQRDKERELKRALWEIRDAIDAYKQAKQSGALIDGRASLYPATLDDLTRATDDARAGKSGQTLRFLRRVPRDPFARADGPAAATWGLRSFQSEAESPKPGEDVYDVYSLSDKRALDGSALRSW